MTSPALARKTQEERTALSDRRMMAAAVSLIVEVGLQATTLAAIGERAGYSRGLVTHRFGTKAGLFAYVYDTVIGDWLQRLRDAVSGRNGLAALLAVVDALCGFIDEAPDEIRAMYLLRFASIDPAAEFRANVVKSHNAQKRDLQKWIRGGQKDGSVDPRIDPPLAAELLCAEVEGLIFRWLANPDTPVRTLHRLLKKELQRRFARVKK